MLTPPGLWELMQGEEGNAVLALVAVERLRSAIGECGTVDIDHALRRKRPSGVGWWCADIWSGGWEP
jgi:hypothetical protein